MPGALKQIGIGIAGDAEKVIAGIPDFAGRCGVVCYCRPGTLAGISLPENVSVIEHVQPEQALVGDLAAGTIAAAVRGTLPANSTLKALKNAMGVDHLERIALLETARGRKFLLAPVGVDEGWTIEEKTELIRKGQAIAKKFGLPEKVGVLSGGRLGDIGRHQLQSSREPPTARSSLRMRLKPAGSSLHRMASPAILSSERSSFWEPGTDMARPW
jgi:predicted methyltransferase MtxX (methanogen marker protein 4)